MPTKVCYKLRKKNPTLGLYKMGQKVSFWMVLQWKSWDGYYTQPNSAFDCTHTNAGLELLGSHFEY